MEGQIDSRKNANSKQEHIGMVCLEKNDLRIGHVCITQRQASQLYPDACDIAVPTAKQEAPRQELNQRDRLAPPSQNRSVVARDSRGMSGLDVLA